MVLDKNFTDLTNTNTIFLIRCFLLVENCKLKSLLTPSFHKIQSKISVALSTGITIFSVGRIDYVNSRGNVKAGTTVFASPLSISLSFTFLKLFLFT